MVCPVKSAVVDSIDPVKTAADRSCACVQLRSTLLSLQRDDDQYLRDRYIDRVPLALPGSGQKEAVGLRCWAWAYNSPFVSTPGPQGFQYPYP